MGKDIYGSAFKLPYNGINDLLIMYCSLFPDRWHPTPPSATVGQGSTTQTAWPTRLEERDVSGSSREDQRDVTGDSAGVARQLYAGC